MNAGLLSRESDVRPEGCRYLRQTGRKKGMRPHYPPIVRSAGLRPYSIRRVKKNRARTGPMTAREGRGDCDAPSQSHSQ
ncbi:hypothetical protein IE4771_CH03982 [Rhizobium etli bv. mimosae str. IE4771]|uniref:Uncharacterized protein n=1 Tax=Rhizobium etli bv. mimosae str. IE4771 TaxID=1432050 RepID=A0A060I5L9_RHIET|nr:hypothetical protein IE4771_CH03982 [Rhizobium sp. IE4771]ARQ60022.1 hypothetical protein Kim5_CH04018 [Rhizobium sp. Kim5]